MLKTIFFPARAFGFALVSAFAFTLALPAISLAQATPSASSPAYRSAFAGYQPYQEVEPADWKASNVQVSQKAATGSAEAPRTTAAVPERPASAPAAPAATGPASAPVNHDAHHGAPK